MVNDISTKMPKTTHLAPKSAGLPCRDAKRNATRQLNCFTQKQPEKNRPHPPTRRIWKRNRTPPCCEELWAHQGKSSIVDMGSLVYLLLVSTTCLESALIGGPQSFPNAFRSVVVVQSSSSLQEETRNSGKCKVLIFFEGLIFLLACSVHFVPPTILDDFYTIPEKSPKSSADKM